MKKTSEFDRVSRQYAVQALLNACYAETMHLAAGFLEQQPPSCNCSPGGVMKRLADEGVLDGAEMAALRGCCEDCRRSLERAARAWASGDPQSLRDCLAEYRHAAGTVRAELVRIAQ